MSICQTLFVCLKEKSLSNEEIWFIVCWCLSYKKVNIGKSKRRAELTQDDVWSAFFFASCRRIVSLSRRCIVCPYDGVRKDYRFIITVVGSTAAGKWTPWRAHRLVMETNFLITLFFLSQADGTEKGEEELENESFRCHEIAFPISLSLDKNTTEYKILKM